MHQYPALAEKTRNLPDSHQNRIEAEEKETRKKDWTSPGLNWTGNGNSPWEFGSSTTTVLRNLHTIPRGGDLGKQKQIQTPPNTDTQQTPKTQKRVYEMT